MVKGRLENGFSTDELKNIAKNNLNTEYISISDKLPSKLRKDNEAGISFLDQFLRNKIIKIKNLF